MNILEMYLEDLRPYENNPRKNEKAVPYVKQSIQDFGFWAPLVIDKNNVIVCGHTRFKAAQELKLEKVPCVLADELTDEQVKAFRLVDNQTNEYAVWDSALLNLELEGIGIDMSQYGFTIGRELQNSSEEINVADFADDTFNRECPFCGFRFND